MQAFFNPSKQTLQASIDFNQWLKETILVDPDRLEKLKAWKLAPGGIISHPREEHLLPLLMVAAAGGDDALPKLIYDTTPNSCDPAQQLSEYAVTGYLFQ
jgi:aromatic ring-opening dioxygenase catalytic subunit (LigB family)